MVWLRRRRAALAVLLACLATAVCLGMAATAGPSRDPRDRPEDFRLAAGFGCLDEDSCLAGLRSVYGFDLLDRMAILPDGMGLAEALETGEADVAVLPSAEQARDSGFIVLTEDRRLFSADVVVPIGARDSLLRGGIWLHDAVDAVSAALDGATVRRVVTAVEKGADLRVSAKAWVRAAGLPREARSQMNAEEQAARAASVTVGGLATPEGEVLAALYAVGLTAQGFKAKVGASFAEIDGFVAGVTDGSVTLGVAHLTPMLLSLTDRTRTIVGDEEAALGLLRSRLNRRGVAVYGAADVLAGPVLAARTDVAERLGLSSWSDLARYAEPVRTAAEVAAPAAVQEADADLSVGDRGPAVQRMQARLVQVGHDPGRTDGIFDERTRRAVLSFQQSQILPTTGVVGQLTRRRLDVPYGPEGDRAAAAERAAEGAAEQPAG